ncbi:MAG: hypothetical protein KJ798_09305 [Gammaproteobacteria bacterium]|uniref:N-acyl amino acid synthase FeeM domain-containing protein n=1 Tax=Limnobacter sp. TaxID=2003368 RepID=UPI001DA36CD9|nr:hypothetical protein [Limnobacter sp.]MBU0783341.1 hypothetical protein [Gammaproteobacteria bacterium]MBU0850560.1 hypothetical protein [Gammaproteobacteria bacterium]MBU1268354.1 hypothetical protein [Gammaproteobacteria bacterium]MBU1530198.1 hypothetical protein [Gammaproteobacteria bacterium]MBU1780572.1 hypothetical protein [Gammaproteobacteria bacterium]
MASPTAVNFPSDSTTQLLPFWIAQAKSDHDLELAAKARQVAYGKHLPEFGDRLATPDVHDRDDDFAVLLAYSKLDSSCIGTVRIQISNNSPLALETSFRLPGGLRTGRIAEISRLAIPASSNGLTLRLMLIKAAYWYCRANHVDRSFICVRHPLDRQYRRFDLEDVLPNSEFIPMQHIGMIPHRILWFDVNAIEERWLQNGNPLHTLYVSVFHPDVLDNLQARTLLQAAPDQLRFHG